MRGNYHWWPVACVSEGCSDWKEHMEPVPAVG
jgi:hypothetical protein